MISMKEAQGRKVSANRDSGRSWLWRPNESSPLIEFSRSLGLAREALHKRHWHERS